MGFPRRSSRDFRFGEESLWREPSRGETATGGEEVGEKGGKEAFWSRDIKRVRKVLERAVGDLDDKSDEESCTEKE